ncbi:hypothetical protein BLS_003014 [Venturia inaequalis]|uniref:CinA C-terminal domain-containing protein n=1 Tax=Venturia inaequalis TaxID=5025 RepID=A0A8H3ZA54_VENIN|nr:hypothetical protein BLS_003014 [Venturia inaequalis]
MASSAFPPEPLAVIAQEVSDLLKEKGESVAVAETLYTLESRIAYAGWTEENLKDYKGPTPDLVAGLAEHTRKTLGSTYVVGESGTAGPTGGTTKNRIPGYVALAVSSANGTYKRELDTGFGKDRQKNMVGFAVEALTLLRDVLKGDAKL